jgi:acyl carrier protein
MNEKIIECIYAAIDEANDQRNPDDPVMEKSFETTIHGDSSALDSLGLVNFVVAVEENVEKAFGSSLMLADDRALVEEPSPFQSVGNLAVYVETLLREEREG